MENFNNYILNLNYLKHNYNQIKNYVGSNVKVCAMVKADGYGHGAKDVCKAIKHADFFGVASVHEAKNIRKFNKTTPILVVGIVNLEYVLWCSNNNVSIGVSALTELENIVKVLNGKPLNIHIKVNTGLNRIGVNNVKEFLKMLKVFKTNKNLKLEGVFTHFATKLNDVEFIVKQHETFQKFIKHVNPQKVIIHCCNSFATLMFPKCHYGMVRCGFNLYGWELDYKLTLKPALNITSKIIFKHKIKKGETVGYDRTFLAQKNCVVGVLPIGYADGFDRRLSNNFKVLVNGKWANVIGNICMDICMIDLTGINAEVGDEVVLLGRSGGYEITPYTYAKALGTSPYEILLKFQYSRMNKINIE